MTGDTDRDQARARGRRRATQRGRSGRAPAMSVEDRQAAIVAVAVPMLIERGGAVSTGEIAAAAGIAEGTLFRAFKDKQALYTACLNAVLESDAELAHIESVDRSLPLAKRLIEAVQAVSDYQNRAWSMVVALRAAGIDPRQVEPRHEDAPNAMFRISGAVATLFDAADLRVSPDLAARLLLGFVFTNRLQAEGLGDTGASLTELVDLFLNGTLRTPTGGKETP